MSHSSGSALSAFSTDQPSRSGMMMSSVITSGRACLGEPEALAAAGGMQDVVARAGELALQQVVGGLLVVDDQDRAAAGPPMLVARRLSRPQSWRPGRWPAARS